jgi:diguanylate cyclase (GGDEF)-like protein
MPDPLYEAWFERNTYATTLLFSGFIAILLPAFHYVLEAVPGVPYDSLPLRLICTAVALIVAGALLARPKLRAYAELLQFFQILVTIFVIDVLVVDSRDQYLYIASALLVIIGVQNAFFRVSTLALSMGSGLLFFMLYSWTRGMSSNPYGITTIAIFATGYGLAFIPAFMHIRSRQSDIRSRLRAIEATAELEEAHAITHLGKWSQDLVTGEVNCSAELLRILRLPLDTPSSALPQLYSRSIHPEDRVSVERALEWSRSGGEFSVDHRIVFNEGSQCWVQLSGKHELDGTGEPNHRLGTVIDITARKEAEISLERFAKYDPLTNLPNRTLLREELNSTLDGRRVFGRRCAVMFLDLDRFKDINDSLGHSVGDLLLKEVAARIRSLLPVGTLVARWGGDEFVAVLDEAQDDAAIERTCRRLVHGLSTPFAVDAYEFAVTASIGVAVFPVHGDDPEVLIRNADTAMYDAKERPGQHYAFFEPQMHAVATLRHEVQNQLRTGVANGAFSLYYQPIIDAATNRMYGAEALLRWTDGTGRIRLPEDFIHIAEDTGSIIGIGMWVVEEAARQAIRWQQAGMPISVSVNISPRQLAHPDFAEALARVMLQSRVDPSLLEIEITESVLMPNQANVISLLGQIRTMGLRIAVDDFGTGYSAFSYLKAMPLNSLKIDRTFVEGIDRDVDRAIAESIISIAHKLDLSVTAEGVENDFQRKILSDLGCDRLQGFQICKPLPVADFEDFARVRAAAS